MTSTGELHKAQSTILYTLQYATRARYSELQHAAHMESDVFKFHIRKLRRTGHIVKADDGLYELTAEGKALVSRLDKQTGREIEQPKSSMLMVVRSGDLVLGHRRDRFPHDLTGGFRVWARGGDDAVHGEEAYALWGDGEKYDPTKHGPALFADEALTSPYVNGARGVTINL